MHPSSMKKMRELVTKYHISLDGDQFELAEVGASTAKGAGTYKLVARDFGFKYSTIDIIPGPNVTHVVPETGNWRISHLVNNCWETKLFDLVISGQCMEHVRQPWVWMRQIAGILKVGGLAIVIAPNTWRYHEHPVDCWRVWPEGMRATFEWAELETLEVGYEGTDTWGVARKS